MQSIHIVAFLDNDCAMYIQGATKK